MPSRPPRGVCYSPVTPVVILTRITGALLNCTGRATLPQVAPARSHPLCWPWQTDRREVVAVEKRGESLAVAEEVLGEEAARPHRGSYGYNSCSTCGKRPGCPCTLFAERLSDQFNLSKTGRHGQGGPVCSHQSRELLDSRRAFQRLMISMALKGSAAASSTIPFTGPAEVRFRP